MNRKNWFDIRFTSSTLSFIAIAMRNFAIGCELVGFFPQGKEYVQTGVVVAGAVIMFLAVVLHYVCILLNQTSGDLE